MSAFIAKRRRPTLVTMVAGIALLTACNSVSLDSLDRRARRLGKSTTVVADDLTVWSPYDAATTARFVDLLRRERDAVASALGADVPKRILVWIAVGLDAEGGPVRALHGSTGGLRGKAATDGRTMALFGPQNGAIAPGLLTSTIRHEFVHLICRQEGLDLPRWISEGIALAVESRVFDDEGQLVPAPVPATALWRAPALLEAVSIETLLDWRGRPRSRELELALYDLSHAFFAYQHERRSDVSELELARALLASEQADLIAQDSPWRGWLAELNCVAELERSLQSSDPAHRRRAFSLLPVWAEMGRTDALGTESVRLALDGLQDDVVAYACANYLVHFCSGHITPTQVDALLAADDPVTRLTGAALALRGGREFDRDRCRDALSKLPRNERGRLREPLPFVVDRLLGE